VPGTARRRSGVTPQPPPLPPARAQVRNKERVQAAREAEAAKVAAAAAELEATAARTRASMSTGASREPALDAELARLAAETERLSAQRHDLQKEAGKLAEDVKAGMDAVTRLERDLYATTSHAMRAGVSTVKDLRERAQRAAASEDGAAGGAGRKAKPRDPDTDGIDGIYGPIIELFKPTHTRYNTAIDVVAGVQLFNVIVRDDKVASTLVDYMIRKRAGRVTITPLANISPPAVVYPTGDDCRPLKSFLEYEPRFKPAIEQLFGRVLLCKDLETASRYARSHHLTCVTLAGEVVDRKGAMQGGFLDAKAARLSIIGAMYETA
jgi:structural maintenance of chromosome 3 (chondroitin sulfate proteoglycan 6)